MRPTTFAAAVVIAGMSCAGVVRSAHAQNYKHIYSFPGGRHGNQPYSELVEFRGRLYGTTAKGGPPTPACNHGGCGTLFSLDPRTGKQKVVHAFQGGDGELYTDPAGLIVVGNLLYGTTSDGGSSGGGTLFSFNPVTGTETVVHAFGGGNDGINPIGSLLLSAGLVYGVTINGGANNRGTVFSYDPATGAETVLDSFQRNGNYGSRPAGGLIDVAGILYGTTQNGGALNIGTVFSLDPATGLQTTLYSFGTDQAGKYPQGSLVRVGDRLYGTTLGGGQADAGTVFSIDTASGNLKSVYIFVSGSDGQSPTGGLVNVSGVLYGTTFYGGGSSTCAGGCGTIFSLDVVSGTESVPYAFQGGSDGEAPGVGLSNLHGVLYGTTSIGGVSNHGTAFAYTP